MNGFFKDIQFASRQLYARPAFTAVAVIVLALGLGATAAIFSVVHAVLMQPLPYPDPKTLVRVFESDVIGNAPDDAFNVVSPGLFQEWQKDAHSLSAVAAVYETSFNISSKSESFTPEHINGLACSSTFPEILDVHPILGRFFNPSEDQFKAPYVAVLSYRLWQQRFAGARTVLGRQVRLNGNNYTIVGVLPKNFVYPGQPAEVFVPFMRTLDIYNQTTFSNHFLDVIARLAPGYSMAAAEQELTAVVRDIRRTRAKEIMGSFATVAAFNGYLVRDYSTALTVLLGAVGCLLLIACVNIANLLLTRALGRHRELAIRLAVGASRAQIVRQVLVESSILSLVGAAAGLLVANWLSSLLASHAPGADQLPQTANIHIDKTVLAFTTCVALLSGIGAGLFPAFAAARTDLASGMKDTSRSSTAGRSHAFLRQFLVGLEVAISLVLLIAAGLLLRSFLNLENVSPGFRTANSISFELSLPDAVYNNRRSVANFIRRLREQVHSIPGINAVGLVSYPPMAGHWSDSVFHIEGHPMPEGQMMDLLNRKADPDYFRALGIPLLRGRVFNDQDGVGYDDKHPLLGKAIISDATAKKFFRNLDPIGQIVAFGTDAGLPPDPERNPFPRFQIIGVAGDVPTDPATGIEPTIYRPLLEGGQNDFYAIVRTDGDPTALTRSIRRVLQSLDPDLPMHNVRTFAQINAESTADRRFTTSLLMLFAIAALLLAATGLYGVVSYNVTQRTSEIGIRMALGAKRREVSRIVLLDGLKPAALGLAIGFAASFALTQVLKSMLFKVSTFDRITFATVPIILAMTVVLACVAPAMRAASVDPTTALRSE